MTHTHGTRFWAALGCLSLAHGTALAQAAPDRIEILVDPPVLEPGQSATITLQARFDGATACALSAVVTDLLVSQHAAALSATELVRPFGGDAGDSDPAGVRSITAWQLTGLAGETGDLSNPIHFWQASFTAPDTDRPLSIVMATRTWLFEVNTQCCGHCFDPEARLPVMDEGVATIRIVPCQADLDADGELTLFDFLTFQNLFDAGDPIADFDGDGELTLFDFLAFQNAFDAGCE